MMGSVAEVAFDLTDDVVVRRRGRRFVARFVINGRTEMISGQLNGDRFPWEPRPADEPAFDFSQPPSMDTGEELTATIPGDHPWAQGIAEIIVGGRRRNSSTNSKEGDDVR